MEGTMCRRIALNDTEKMPAAGRFGPTVPRFCRDKSIHERKMSLAQLASPFTLTLLHDVRFLPACRPRRRLARRRHSDGTGGGQLARHQGAPGLEGDGGRP